MIKILNLFHTVCRRKSMFGIQPQNITCVWHIFQKMEDKRKLSMGREKIVLVMLLQHKWWTCLNLCYLYSLQIYRIDFFAQLSILMMSTAWLYNCILTAIDLWETDGAL